MKVKYSNNIDLFMMCKLIYSFINIWIAPVIYFYLFIVFNAFWQLYGV